MPLPTAKQIAGIVWAECGGIRESQTQATSARTYEHRLAIATVVVNRVRQNLNYNDGRGTARERYPSGSALQNPDVVEAWQETQLAAEDGLQTVRYILTSNETLEGAQFYCHVYQPWHRRGGGARSAKRSRSPIIRPGTRVAVSDGPSTWPFT